jgi:integrase
MRDGVNMAKSRIDQLTALKVQRIIEPGTYLDGRGLYLQVSNVKVPKGRAPKPEDAQRVTKSWLFVYTGLNGKKHEMGLGSLADVGLKEAREGAERQRKIRAEGKDPIEERKRTRTAAALSQAKAITFDECRDKYIAAHRAGWRNAKHATQWTNTLATYVTPVFGKLDVRTIDISLVTKVLEPLWSVKPETASRVRGRIERILDWARVRGYRDGENPARWRGHLDHLLPARSKVRQVQHHAALSYCEIGAFMVALREREALAARALEFTILTAARTGETIGAKWDEVDLQAKLWTVPAERMKPGREHRVPLSDPAVKLLKQMAEQCESDYVFPGDRRDKLSNMAMDMLVRRMNRNDITVHGFRSCFRDWAAECTSFPREVAEAALAHVVGNKTEAAYQRGDLFEKRRKLMDAWASYCSKLPAKVLLEFPGRTGKGSRAARRLGDRN